MAFLNSPMAEVWRATKRTFADLMDVDSSSSSSSRSDTVEGARSRQSNTNSDVSANRPNNSSAASVSYNVSSNVNKVNARLANNVWTTDSTVSTRGKFSKFNPDSGGRGSNLSFSHDILRRKESPDDTDSLPLRSRPTSRTTDCLNQSSPNISPSATVVSERNRELLLSSSQLQSRLEHEDRILAVTHKTNVHASPRPSSQPRTASPSFTSSSVGLQNVKATHLSEQKVKSHKLHILPSGFSPPRTKQQVTSPVDYNDFKPLLNHSQTVPELGLYPQYASFQPREATVQKDFPIDLPSVESSDIQRRVSAHGKEGQKTTVVGERPSRPSIKSTRRRFRSSSSDRASEMKVLHRRPSYNKSQTIDARKIDDDDDDDWFEQAEKVKLKFMSMWNNVKYGWTVKTKTPFNIHKAIWLLGRCYHHRPEDPDLDKLHPGINTVRSPAMELFKQDFVSRIWLTYRREFPQLSGSTLTTDCGWGCMLRSGQMLLAQALILHFLGRDWNLYKGQTVESHKLHRQIIRWFGDQPSDMSPFSLHHLVEIGKQSGKRAGDWFGPASVAHIVKDAVDQAPELNPMLESVCIYVSQDCTVYKQDVIDLCTRPRKKSLKPVYHDVPDVRAVERSTTDTLQEALGTPSPQSEKLLSQQSSQTSFEMVGLEARNFESTCNKTEGSEERTAKDRMSSAASSADKETNVSDDSFERLIQNFNSEFEKYSPDGVGTVYDEQDCSNTAVGKSPYPDTGASNQEQRTVLSSPLEVDANVKAPVLGFALSPNQTSSKYSLREVFDDGGDLSKSEDYVRPRKENARREDAGQEEVVRGKDKEKKDCVTHSSDSTANKDIITHSSNSTDSKDSITYSSNSIDKKEDINNSNRTDNKDGITYSSNNIDKKEDIICSNNSTDGKDGITHSSNSIDKTEEITHSNNSTDDKDGIAHSSNSKSSAEESSRDWCAVIILVPVRLGGEEVNGIYIRPIQSLFSMTNCIGIIGGKPKHSLYFVGFQDEKLIHLDPHYCQPVVDMTDKEFPIWSFHCMSPRKMAINKMDPSCTIGFYLKTREDFDKFCIEIQQVINPPGNGKDYPMFIVREGRCRDWNAQHEMSSKSERYLRVRHVNEDGKLISPVTAAEDFVLLD